MPSFAPQRTGQFVIKPLARKRRRFWRTVAVLLVILVPYLAFETGRTLAGYSIVTSLRHQATLSDQLKYLQSQLTQARRELGNTRLALRVEQQAGKGWQRSLSEAQNTIQKQQEELGFYRAIVRPEQTADTPSVQRLEIHPGEDPQHYQVRLVLIQPAQRNHQAEGDLSLMVDGRNDGQPVRLTLAQLAPELKRDTLDFSYRYFQELQQDIVLPAGFEPLSVEVDMRADKQPVRQQRFTWKLTE